MADPIKKNPVPVGHPLHEVWERAYRAAQRKLLQLKEQLLAEYPRSDDDVDKQRTQRAVGTFRIWAEQGVSIVVDYAGVRAYQQWLKDYRESMLQFAKDNPQLYSQPVLTELEIQLLLAETHWAGRAHDQVAALEAGASPPAANPAADPPVETSEPARPEATTAGPTPVAAGESAEAPATLPRNPPQGTKPPPRKRGLLMNGAYLKELRLGTGMTQEDFAEKLLGVGLSTFKKALKGGRLEETIVDRMVSMLNAELKRPNGNPITVKNLTLPE